MTGASAADEAAYKMSVCVSIGEVEGGKPSKPHTEEQPGLTKSIAPASSDVDPASREPGLQPFIAVCLYSVLTVTGFTISIPTSERYTASFGVDNTLAGILVGLVPIFSALMQPFVIRALGTYRFIPILYCGCVVNMAGLVLYALAPLTDNFATVLVARAIMGTAGGPAYMSTYIARTTGPKTRGKWMMRMSVAIGMGYALGPLLGLLCEVVANEAGWNYDVFDANTVPAWLMVVLFAGQVAVLFLFAEGGDPPPKQGGDAGAKKGPAPPAPVELPWGTICLYYAQIFLTPINVAGWEIMTVFWCTLRWGWTIEMAALTIALVNMGVVSLGVANLNLNHFFKGDRTGALVSFCIGAAAAVLFFNFSSNSVALEASLFIFGGLLLVFGMQNAKGFLFSINSKWTPNPGQRSKVMMINNILYMLGRGCGAIAAPYTYDVTQGFGGLILGVNLAAVAVAFVGLAVLVRASGGAGGGGAGGDGDESKQAADHADKHAAGHHEGCVHTIGAFVCAPVAFLSLDYHAKHGYHARHG
jgi:MFS family permease